MAEPYNPRNAGRFQDRITLGNLITIAMGIVCLAAAWGSLQADIRALAQRVDKGENHSDRTDGSLDGVKAAVSDLKGDVKSARQELDRQGRQLDRIEQLLQQRAPTTLSPPTPPPR